MARTIVGAGNYTYEVIWPFGQLPTGMHFGSVSHVAVDSQDRVYVYQRQNPPVLVFDRNGKLLRCWGDDLLVDGHGIYITAHDEIFAVARGVHEVLKFDTGGNVLLRIGNREKPSFEAPFNHPTDVAVSPTGEIYVTDGYGNTKVHKFSSEGQLLHSWGAPGVNPGEFSTPHGVWIDNQSQVYVADRENNRVQIFSSEGLYLNEWRNFYHPMDIFMDREDAVYVTDQTPRFTVINRRGEVLSRGFAPDAGHGIYGDAQGNLYLAGLQRGVAKLVRQ